MEGTRPLESLTLLRGRLPPKNLICLPAGGRKPLNLKMPPALTLRQPLKEPRAALRPPPALPPSGLPPSRTPSQFGIPKGGKGLSPHGHAPKRARCLAVLLQGGSGCTTDPGSA